MPEQILTEIEGSETPTLIYKVDGANFLSFGVNVMSSKGMQDLPSMKEPLIADWPGAHGTVVDLAAPRYNNREIEFNCFIQADGKFDFFSKVRAFINAFQKPYLRTLELWVSNKPLFYKVYLPDGIEIDKEWKNGDMFGTFVLKLIEPTPIKRLIKCTDTLVSFSFTSANPIDIYWSDGDAAYNVMGTAVTKSKTFGTAAERYILLCGVIEGISDFTILSDNTEVVWTKY